MSVKKKSIEKQMSQSIFYNLSILKHAVKTTPEFDECFASGMFIKSNTKAFIYITHFLFNIIDAKEFKAKFYWPIADKKGENAYRSSSIELINSLIDKHNLSQEKVKLVFVVHPGGKKFMSLILDLITLAIKEVMRRKRITAGKSFEIEEVTEACSNMKTVENNLVNSIKTETKVIKEKVDEIQSLIKEIFPSKEIPMEFSEFIESWHDHNKVQLEQIKQRNAQMSEIYKKTGELYDRAKEMLAQKKYEVAAPPSDLIKDVAEFYENAGAINESFPTTTINNNLNLVWLILQLHLVLPAIINYVTNFTFDSSDSSDEELKVLKRLATEVMKIESKFDEFVVKFRKDIPALIAKLKKEKEERESEEIPEEDPEKDQIELESLKLLMSPKYYFDASKECLKNVVVKKTRLALLEDEEGKENLNESKLYRPSKSPFPNKSLKQNQTVVNEMGPPRQNLRRRLDPMAMLEQATSRNRTDLNTTNRFAGAIPKRISNPQFSSTMLSPDFRQPLFNCSTVSEICKSSPLISPQVSIESMFGDTVKCQEVKIVVSPPKNKHMNSDSIPWDDSDKMSELQSSPRGGLKSLVSAEEIFKVNSKTEEETIKNSESESTMKNKTDCEASYSSFVMMVLPTDDNLFNVSDTVLQAIDDD